MRGKEGKKSHETEVKQSIFSASTMIPFNLNVLYKRESPCRHH
jgi:hypothetical protein